MANYHLVRVWQLKPGCTGTELEALMASGYLEMQRWIPGVKHIALVRAYGSAIGRYMLTTTFTSYEAYTYWRQVEQEAADYWERTCYLLEEYAGELVVHVDLEDSVPS